MKIRALFLLILGSCLVVTDAFSQKVSIRKEKRSYTLLKDGQPFFAKGAIGTEYPELFKEAGGNTLFTWDINGFEQTLTNASEHNLMVILGLQLPDPTRFNYNDENAKAQLVETYTEQLLKFKRHKNLLIWAVGYEIDRYEDEAMWVFMNSVAGMCKLLDPSHPVMTTLMGASKESIRRVKKELDQIDILGINTLGSLEQLPSAVRSFGWQQPYMVTTWGPNASWDAPTTNWGAILEPSDNKKAEVLRERYSSSIADDSKLCFGSFVYYWGALADKTLNWYGLLAPGGVTTPQYDILFELWNGRERSNRSPVIHSFTIAGKTAYENIILGLESQFTAQVQAVDPNKDELAYTWVFRKDDPEASENKFSVIEGLITRDDGYSISFNVPNVAGPYRLYLYVSDSQGNISSANIPFFVN